MKNLILIALVLNASIFTIAQTWENAVDSLFMDWANTAEKQPGVAIAIIDGDATVYQKTFGLANLEYEIPLTEDAIFDLASLAKQFTGFAIAKLELEGKLSSEDTLGKYLSTLPAVLSRITIGQCIHHSSGIRDIGELFGVGHFGSDLTAEKTLEIMQRQRDLNFVPGAENDYSNSNYVLLAKIVESISGMSFRSWCDLHIFSPLAMNNSFANDNPKEIIVNRAVAYYRTDAGYTFDQNNGMSLIGSSAIFSSIDNMSKWAHAMLNNVELKPIFDQMKVTGSLSDGRQINYGYGLATEEFKGKNLLVHSGSTPAGFRSLIAFFPDEKKAFVLLSNFGNVDLGSQFLHPIFEILFGKDGLEENGPDSIESVQNKINLSEVQLAKFVGEYLFNNERRVTIQKKPDGLTVQPEGAPEMKLIPLSENKLDFPDFRSALEFHSEKSGKFMAADIMQGKDQAGSLARAELKSAEDLDLSSYQGRYYSSELDLHLKITAEEKALSIYDSKSGSFEIEPRTKDVFIMQSDFANTITFQITPNEKIDGFLLNRGSRMRNLAFKRIE